MSQVGEGRRRTRVALVAATSALVVLLAGGVWYVGSVVAGAARWLRENLDATPPDIEDRLDAAARSFAELLRDTAQESYPTVPHVAAAAGASGVMVATIGMAPSAMRIWAVAVEPDVSVEGDSAWACFFVTIDGPGTGAAHARVDWPDGGCLGPDVPDSLAFPVRWLVLRDALLRYGRGLDGATSLPATVPVLGRPELAVRAADGDGEAITALDTPATIVLGPPDSYLYGLRLSVGPEPPRVSPPRLPATLDPATRAGAEADAVRLLTSAMREPSVGADGLLPVAVLDRDLGALIWVLRYETTADAVTLHVAVEVVEGGWGARASDPSASTVLVCHAVVVDRSAAAAGITPEPCGYPLVPSA